MRTRRIRTGITLAAVPLAVAGSLIGLTAPAFATPSQFGAGDLVVEQVGTVGGATPSSTSALVSLWDYSTAGTPSGFVVTLPSSKSSDTTTSHSLVDSGSATYNGEISLSGDGQDIYVAGYDDNVGTTKLTSTVSDARTVGIVSSTGTIDTSTALTSNSTNGSGLTASGINFRSATGSTGSEAGAYSGGDDGLQISTDGATSATSLTQDAVHQLLISNNQLYESTTSAIEQIGTGTPTTGTQSDTSLIASPPAKFEPAGFGFATLGSGTAPDTLYVADTGNNAVEKYSFNGSTWVAKGSVTESGVTGIAVSVNAGVASIYCTNQSGLYRVTDSSGAGGTLPSSPLPTTLATAPAGESMKGVVFAAVASPNQGATPEVPFVLALPVLAGVGFAGFIVYRRRRQIA